MLLRHLLRDDHVVGRLKCGRWVALHQRETENLEEGRVDDEEAALVERLAAAFHACSVKLVEPHGAFDGRLLAHEARCHRRGHVEALVRPVPAFRDLVETIDAVRVFVEVVVGKLISHEKGNQQARCHPYGQPPDVDEGVAGAALEVTVGDLEVVAKHSVCAFRVGATTLDRSTVCEPGRFYAVKTSA